MPSAKTRETKVVAPKETKPAQPSQTTGGGVPKSKRR